MKLRAFLLGVVGVAVVVAFYYLSIAQTSVVPYNVAGTWRLVFQDEFYQEQLDGTVWETSYFSGDGPSVGPSAEEVTCYDGRMVSLQGGLLRLGIGPNVDPACVNRGDSTAPYVGGMISSRPREDGGGFSFTYGFVEAKIYLAGNDSSLANSPAFWTSGEYWPHDGEIDIMEGLLNISGGDTLCQPCLHYHYHNGTQHTKAGSCLDTLGIIGPDTLGVAGWHVFGAYWEPHRIRFFYDGAPVDTISTGVVSSSQYIVLNYGVTPNDTIPAGEPVSPSVMLVDYVRVWKGELQTPPKRTKYSIPLTE